MSSKCEWYVGFKLSIKKTLSDETFFLYFEMRTHNRLYTRRAVDSFAHSTILVLNLSRRLEITVSAADVVIAATVHFMYLKLQFISFIPLFSALWRFLLFFFVSIFFFFVSFDFKLCVDSVGRSCVYADDYLCLKYKYSYNFVSYSNQLSKISWMQL